MGKIKKVNEMASTIEFKINTMKRKYGMVAFPVFDWKEISEHAIEQFEEAIKDLGGYMYDDPMFEGSDAYGFIISKKPMDEKAIEKWTDLQEEYMDLQ